MKKVVVSDTGALISFETLPKGFKLAQKLYSKIVIPVAVAEELINHYNSFGHYLKKYNIEGFIEVVESEIDFQIFGIEALDRGEAEAISLAFRLGAPLLIEEKKGRQIAENARVEVVGVGGVIVTAVYNKIIKKQEASEMIQGLFQNKRINNRIYQLLAENISNTVLK